MGRTDSNDRPLVESGWEIRGIREAQGFFAAVSGILPSGACFCFEGTSMARDVRRAVESFSIPPRRHVRAGTRWPKPLVLHVPASAEFLQRIVEVAGVHAEPEICDHLHAYDDGGGLLQWYDAFDLPLLVSARVPEADVDRFCRTLGATRERWSDGAS